MLNTKRFSGALALLISLSACAAPPPPSGPRVLAAMPNGSLDPGETVLVDDGTCPAGQIKQVIGGSNRFRNTDVPHPGTARHISCVPRR